MRRYLFLLALLMGSAAGSQPAELARWTKSLQRGDADAAALLADRFAVEAAAPLAAALGHRDLRVRRESAAALWRLAAEAGASRESVRAQTEALQQALDDADADVAMNAAGALQALGWSDEALAEPRRRVLYGPASGYARFLAARGLIGIEPGADVGPALLEFLFEVAPDGNTGRSDSVGATDNLRLAHAALERLLQQEADSALPLLLAELHSAHPAVPSLLTLAHARYRRIPDWPERLLQQTESPNPEARERAWDLLGELRRPDEARRWVPVAAARLADAVDPDPILGAIEAQAGADASTADALADFAADRSRSDDQRLRALRVLEGLQRGSPARGEPAVEASAAAAASRAVTSLLSDPNLSGERIERALSSLRGLLPNDLERAGLLIDLAAGDSRPERRRLYLDRVAQSGSQARPALERLRPFLQDADAQVRASAEAAMDALDPAWRARDRRAAVPLAAPAPATTPTVPKPSEPQLERDDRTPPVRSSGSFPRLYEAIRAGDLRAFSAELDAGLAINQAHRLAPAAQFRITPLQAVVDYCHITELVSTETLVAMARVLLQRGADPGLSGSRDRSALEGAVDSQCPAELVRVLQGDG